MLVARHGRLAHAATIGVRDVERQVPVTEDTIWRFYSMTKPVTGVALLSLYEQGLFKLSDPVERFIPSSGASRCPSAWRTGPSGWSTPSGP